MKSYKISKDDEVLAEQFVEKAWKNHDAHGRSEHQIKYNIRIGKLGEIAFQKMFPSVTEINWDGNKYDPGYDFILGADKIDVKTLDNVGKDKVYYNAGYMRCDYYAVVRDNPISKVAVYIGRVHHNVVKKVGYKVGNASYFDVKHLEIVDF
jgi:hypothetical protein